MRHTATAIASALFLAGCPKGGLPVDLSRYRPTVEFKRVVIDDIDFTKADTEFVFRIDNPSPVGLSVASFTYDLDLNGSGFLQGASDDGLALPAQGHAQFRLPVTLVFADLVRTVADLEGVDEVPFAIAGDFGIETPIGRVTVPYREQGTLPVLRPPRFRIVDARVAQLRPLQNQAVLEVDVGVTHRGGAPLTLDGFRYDLALAGTPVVDGAAASPGVIAPGAEQVITLPVELDLLGLGSSVVRAITNKERVEMTFGASMDVGTPYGPIPLTVDETGRIQLK